MMSELQIENFHCECGSTITIYGSGDIYYKIDTYEVNENEEKNKSSSL